MPTLETVQDTVKTELQTVLAGLKLEAEDLIIQVGKGWPGIEVFNALGKDALKVEVCVNPTNIFQNRTRWQSHAVERNEVTTAIVATLSGDVINPSDSVDLTLSLASGAVAVKENDAVGVPIQLGHDENGASAKAAAGDSLSDLAIKLRDAINSKTSLNPWVSATASGPVVTITNVTSDSSGLKVQAHTGNRATDLYEVARLARGIDICTFHNSPQARRVTGEVLESVIGKWQSNFGLVDANGYSLRVWWIGDRSTDKDVQKNIYRRDFSLLIEYGVTAEEELFSVLVPVSSYNKI